MSDLQARLIFRQGAINTVEKLQSNIQSKSVTKYGSMNNTGEAAQSIMYRWIGDDQIQIISSMPGREFNYIWTLEHGRGPTSEGAKKGNPTLRESILLWIKQRGIVPIDISQKSLAYLIARRIHKEGSLLYRQGGNSGIISEIQTRAWIDENFLIPVYNSYKDEIEKLITGI